MKGRRDPPCIIAVSGDAGGARAMAPVLKELRAEARVHVHAYAYKEAHGLWMNLGIDHTPMSDSPSLGEVGELFGPKKCELLLTSTSFGGIELEKKCIALARKRGIPSVTLLDTWGNYSRRFSDEEGRVAFLPDRIAVIDELAYREMVDEGFNPESLVITGQPAFDDLNPWDHALRLRKKRVIMGKFPMENDEILILFASQPLSLIYGTDPSGPRYLGFDEWKVVRLLIRALDSISSDRGNALALTIRPHPREDPAPYRSLKGEEVKVLVTKDGDSREWIRESDLVTGLNSILLVEACYMGCPVISLQPELRGKDLLPTNHSGLSRAVYHSEEIRPAIEEVLFNTEVRQRMISRLAGMPRDGHAACRVIELVYSMMGI
jgi:hypothetical protein